MLRLPTLVFQIWWQMVNSCEPVVDPLIMQHLKSYLANFMQAQRLTFGLVVLFYMLCYVELCHLMTSMSQLCSERSNVSYVPANLVFIYSEKAIIYFLNIPPFLTLRTNKIGRFKKNWPAQNIWTFTMYLYYWPLISQIPKQRKTLKVFLIKNSDHQKSCSTVSAVFLWVLLRLETKQLQHFGYVYCVAT